MRVRSLINKEIIITVGSLLILFGILLGVSYASFVNEEIGETNVIEYGNIDLSFCSDTSCNSLISNIGQIIGTQTIEGNTVPKNLYPLSREEALETTPYTFVIKNTGTLPERINIYLDPDSDFVPSGDFSNYTNIITDYSDKLNIRLEGSNIESKELSYRDLIEGKLAVNILLNPGEEKIYNLWTWLGEDSPNELQGSYFIGDIRIESKYVPKTYIADGLVLHVNTLVPPINNTLEDLSGMNNSIKLIGFEESSYNGEKLIFDGVNDVIELGLKNYNFETGLSLSFRAKINTLGNTQYLLSNISGIELLLRSNNKLGLDIYSTYLNEWSNFSSEATITSEYKTYTIVYDNTQIKYYIDGELDSTVNLEPNIKTSNNSFIIGAKKDESSYTNFTNMDFQNAMIYNRALTETEIRQNHFADKVNFE